MARGPEQLLILTLTYSDLGLQTQGRPPPVTTSQSSSSGGSWCQQMGKKCRTEQNNNLGYPGAGLCCTLVSTRDPQGPTALQYQS